MPRVLVVDDDEALCGMVLTVVRKFGCDADCCHAMSQAGQKAAAHACDVFFLDLHFPEGNGLDILPQLQESRGRPEVVIATGQGDPDRAELALRHGAWDYIQKPLSAKRITLQLKRALQYREALASRQSTRDLKRDRITGEATPHPSGTHVLERQARREHAG